MTDLLNSLVEALREELQQYGEMLARLDQQQGQILRRAADDLPAGFSAINEQGAAIQAARSKREQLRQEFARLQQLPGDAPFTELIPLLPADYRPLLRALVDENNELLIRIQQRARQNHLLLMRSVELMVNFLEGLFPARQPTLYDGSGHASGRGKPGGHVIYEAIG